MTCGDYSDGVAVRMASVTATEIREIVERQIGGREGGQARFRSFNKRARPLSPSETGKWDRTEERS